jgi:hypothetical protein
MSPKIFYYCNDHRSAIGGQEYAYRHVEILARNGYEAFAWQQEHDFPLSWFNQHAPAVNNAEFRRLFDEGNDYLVLPENLELKIPEHPGRKVVFHRSLDRAFNRLSERVPETYPYAHPSVIGVLAASEHDYRHLKFVFPQSAIYRVGRTVDPQAFRWRPLCNKRKLITWVAREKAHVSLLYHIVHARAQAGLNKASDYHWVPLRDLPQQEIAQTLEESILFISLSEEEGLESALLAAMLSGCLTAGYRIGSLKEYPPLSFHCEYGEHIEMILFIEKVMAGLPEQIEAWEKTVESARRRALDNLEALEERSVLEAWERLLS